MGLQTGLTPWIGTSLVDFIDVFSITEALSAMGVTGLLVLIIIGGMKRWWVFGWIYREKHDECERWKDLALRSLSVSEDIADVVEKNELNHKR